MQKHGLQPATRAPKRRGNCNCRLESVFPNHSDVAFLVAPLRDALGQRHSLCRLLLLGAFHRTLCITAGTLERAILEASTLRIQEAGHALAEALGFGALAGVLAGRPVAAQVGTAEQGLRRNALG